MAVDALLRVSNSQSVAAASTVVSTDVVPLFTGGGVGAVAALPAQGRDMAPGEEISAVVFFPVAGAADLTINIITSATSNMASPTVVGSSGVIPLAQLTAGRAPITVNANPAAIKAQAEGQLYIALQYVTGAGAANTVTAYFMGDADGYSSKPYYDSAYFVAV